MENSKIEWTDHTANFWWGCVKVSPGCEHCYAETWANRWGKQIWGPPATTNREYKKAAWVDLPKWDKQAKASGVRKRVFVQSMADIFEDHPQVAGWRQEAFRLMEECTNLDFQVLTKRPEHIFDFVPVSWLPGLPPNVWIGTSVENQAAADKRIPDLLRVPAAVHFLSCEPLLGPVYLGGFDWKDIDWVIVGGESGRQARPMDVAWAVSLRYQCTENGIPFFMKQLGGATDKRGELTDFLIGLRVREFPRSARGK